MQLRRIHMYIQDTHSRSQLAYLVSNFPAITETFILREIIELERQGLSPALYIMRHEHPDVVHDDANPWIERLHVADYGAPATWIANLLTFLAHPVLYVSLLVETLRELWGS